MTTYTKTKLDVIQASSLRELVETVNRINDSSPSKILKDDIVNIFTDDGTFFLLYYK